MEFEGGQAKGGDAAEGELGGAGAGEEGGVGTEEGFDFFEPFGASGVHGELGLVEDHAEELGEEEVVFHAHIGLFGVVIDEVGGLEDGAEDGGKGGVGIAGALGVEAAKEVILLVGAGGNEIGIDEHGVVPDEAGGMGLGLEIAFGVGGEPRVGLGDGAGGEAVQLVGGVRERGGQVGLERNAGDGPEVGLIGRGGELKFLPSRRTSEPRGKAARGGKAGDAGAKEVGGDEPRGQIEGEGLGKIKGGAGAEIAGLAGERKMEMGDGSWQMGVGSWQLGEVGGEPEISLGGRAGELGGESGEQIVGAVAEGDEGPSARAGKGDVRESSGEIGWPAAGAVGREAEGEEQ